jgi:hypothetical protein
VGCSRSVERQHLGTDRPATYCCACRLCADRDLQSAHFRSSASAASVGCAASAAASQVCPACPLGSALLSLTDAAAAVQKRASSAAARRQRRPDMLGMAGDGRVKGLERLCH